MRQIDADALKAEWYRLNNINEEDRGARFVGYQEIPRLIDNAPTAESTVIRSRTLMPTKDFKEWAKRIRETNPNAVVIPCDAEVVSVEAVHIHNDGTLEVKVPNAQKVGRVLVMDTDSHIGGGLFYPDDAEAEWIPCNKGLPMDLLRVNVTWINHNPPVYYQHIKDIPQTDTAVRYKGNWYWWDATVIDVLAEYGEDCNAEQIDKDIEVIAWMPLPKPYREDGEA